MRVFFDTIGCRLNQAEIEQLAGEFRAAGHTILPDAQGADLVIINSCSVTAAAASDSRQKVRQAEKAGACEIILTGCLATLEPQESSLLPGITRVVPNTEKMFIAAEVLQMPDLFDLEPIARIPLPGLRKRTRAFIKVQDGCDNHCTFCVTRIARGSGVSVARERVLQEVLAAQAGGTKEVVLTGVHLGSWGRDLGKGETLTSLVRYVLENSQIKRLRLSSTEPWDLDEEFFRLWQDERMCRHLHLPLQSGSAGVLKRMARRTTPGEFRELMAHARRFIPGLAVTTDIIVGFPGESAVEFEESLEFVKEMAFSGGHVFKYSAREGTGAAKMAGKVHGKEAIERSQRMREALSTSQVKYLKDQENEDFEVLWESAVKVDKNNWRLHGLTGNYLRASAFCGANRSGQIDAVRVKSVSDQELITEIID